MDETLLNKLDENMGFRDGKRGRKPLEEGLDVLENRGFQNIVTEHLGIFFVFLGGVGGHGFIPLFSSFILFYFYGFSFL
jgi:hypothetical protein